jgi:mRNA interferase HigB
LGLRYLKIKIKNSLIGNFFVIFDKKERLRVIAKKILRDFWESHADCEQQLKAWFQETSKAAWKNPNDIKTRIPKRKYFGR